MTYDAENRLKTSTNGNSGLVTYSYDGEGRRVQKVVASGATTTYVYDAQGQLAAEYSTAAPVPPCTTCWLTADHLGSTRMLTDASGTVQRRYDYLPFGEEIQQGINGRVAPYETGTQLTAPDTSDAKFTGKERDAETGLDYFGARYFSGAQGRFTSPDPAGFNSRHIANPQKWNKYAYVLNNPLIMVDPDGEAEFYVFRPLATSNSSAWTTVQNYTNRKGSPDHMTIYNGPAATSEAYKAALGTEGAHVIDAGGHTVENNTGAAGALLLGDNRGVGDPNVVPSTVANDGMPGGPVIPVGDVKAADVAILGCFSTQLAGQYAGTTFTGTMPTTNTVAEDGAGAAYANSLSRGGTVSAAAGAAQSTMTSITNQANANPNRVMDFKPPHVCTTENGKTTCH